MSTSKSNNSTEKVSHSNKSRIDFTGIIERAMQYLSLQTNEELGERVGKSANTISTWKARNAGDLEAIIEICDGADLNWLILNRETRNIGGLTTHQQTEKAGEEEPVKVLEVFGVFDPRKKTLELETRIQELEKDKEILAAKLEQAERMFTQALTIIKPEEVHT